jgi:fimbrial chaperone protein
MQRGIGLLLYTVMGWILSLPVWAGGLTILPTRIDFGASRSVQSVLLTNTSPQTVTVETQVVVWPEGAMGQLANDVVVTPAVVTLPPNQRIRLRIGLLRPAVTATERAYRLYFTELAAPSPLQGAGIGVRLRIGIPVFVPPAQIKTEPLQWSTHQDAEGWWLTARNDGNVHTRIARVRLVGPAAPRHVELPGNYVLAHSSLGIPLLGSVDSDMHVRWMEGEDEREGALVAP